MTTHRRRSPRLAMTVDPLETRLLFAVTVATPIGNTSGDSSGAATVLDLSPIFSDDAHTFINIHTEVDDYRVELFDQQKPITVQNFLKYVTQNRLDGTIYHRSDVLTGDDADNLQPPTIIQGGGFAFPGFGQIKTDDPIVNEARTNGVISNTRGTLSMARTSDPDSGTSEFFVNVADNAVLDPGPNPADPTDAGYAVFGKVVDADLPTIDAIAALPRFSFGDPQTSPFTHLPLRNFTTNDFNTGVVPGENNVVTETVAVAPDVFTYSANSSDPALVNPSISDGTLVLNYGAGIGSADITVTATALDGSSTQTVFTAGVGQLDLTLGATTGNKSITYTDGDGTVTTVSLKGSGSASIRFTGSGLTQTTKKGKITLVGTATLADTIALAGTDDSTSLSISTKGGDRVTSVNAISADGAVRSISGKGVVITASLSTAGLAPSVTLAGATNATITLGGSVADKPISLSLGTLTDTGIVANAPVKSLKLTTATDTGGAAEQIAGVDLQSISVSSDLGEDINVTGQTVLKSLKISGSLTGDVSARQIGSISVKGGITGSTITATLDATAFADQATANTKVNQAIQSVKAGAIATTTIDSGGSVGSVSAASISGSMFLAGVAPGVTGLATTLADVPAPATINSVKVKGAFAGSTLVSRFLGKVSAGTLSTVNGGVPFGFAADSIASLSGKTDAVQKFAVKNADTQAEADTALTGVTLGDAVVRLL